MFQHGLLVAHYRWLTLMLPSCFWTMRVASRERLRENWDIKSGTNDLTGLESVLPQELPIDMLDIYSEEKYLFCRAASEGLLVRHTQLGLRFSAAVTPRSPEKWPGSCLGCSGALKMPFILNVFAAEALVNSAHPFPTPINAWEASVLILRF